MNFDPRQKINRREIAECIAELVKPAIIHAIEAGTKTCITCDNFYLPEERCNLNGMRPPAKIIAFGCECYQNEIPF